MIRRTKKLTKKELQKKDQLSKLRLANVDKLFQATSLLWEVWGEDTDEGRVCNDERKGKILLDIDECISDAIGLGLQTELEDAVIFAGKV